MEIINSIRTKRGYIYIFKTEENKLIEFFVQDINFEKQKLNIVISTQYKCEMACKYCNAGKIKNQQGNIELVYLIKQVEFGLSKFAKIINKNIKIKVHFARIGEPTFNKNAIYMIDYFIKKKINIYPVLITMMPEKNKKILSFLNEFSNFGIGEIQISINYANDIEKNHFMPNSLNLYDIYDIINKVVFYKKITLNFFICGQCFNFLKIKKLFTPDKYLIKLSPLYITNHYVKNVMIKDSIYYDWKKYFNKFKFYGYECIVQNKTVQKNKKRYLSSDGIIEYLSKDKLS